MAVPSSYSFVRYLSSKKSVDDRALNSRVVERLKHELRNPLRSGAQEILELGAGIGTMVERFLEGGFLREATYTALDSETELIDEAERRLIEWAEGHKFTLEDKKAGSFRVIGGEQKVLIKLRQMDVFDFLSLAKGKKAWDLLIANAFLDLMDLPSFIPELPALLKPGGLFYFTINFDGLTIFEPEIDPALDRQVENLYHETMDSRITREKASGDSRTGRRLFGQLRNSGVEILAAGSSDWVVFPLGDGYAHDEAYFLHHIVDTVRMALETHPDLDRADFGEWIRARHAQIEEGKLVYIAHQLDFLGRV